MSTFVEEVKKDIYSEKNTRQQIANQTFSRRSGYHVNGFSLRIEKKKRKRFFFSFASFLLQTCLIVNTTMQWSL